VPFVRQIRHVSAAEYGILYALQQAVSIIFYLPGRRLADRMGRTPLVAMTFVFFALFPLAVRLTATFPALVAALCIGRAQGNRRAGAKIAHCRSCSRCRSLPGQFAKLGGRYDLCRVSPEIKADINGREFGRRRIIRHAAFLGRTRATDRRAMA
jgi:hypothetical protein